MSLHHWPTVATWRLHMWIRHYLRLHFGANLAIAFRSEPSKLGNVIFTVVKSSSYSYCSLSLVAIKGCDALLGLEYLCYFVLSALFFSKSVVVTPCVCICHANLYQLCKRVFLCRQKHAFGSADAGQRLCHCPGPHARQGAANQAGRCPFSIALKLCIFHSTI